MLDLMDAQELEVFQHLLPCLSNKEGGRPQDSGSRQSQRQAGSGLGKRRRPNEGSRSNSDPVMPLLRAVAQLTLRQEDAINILRMDKSFLLLMRTAGDATMLPTFLQVSKEWRLAKEAKPPKVTSPLRIVLVKAMMVEMHARTQKAFSDEATRRSLLQHFRCRFTLIKGGQVLSAHPTHPDREIAHDKCGSYLLGRYRDRPSV